MSSERDAVKRVIDAFERSDWSEIDVRFGSVRVHLSTNPGIAAPNPGPRTASMSAEPMSAAPEATAPGAVAAATAPGANPPIDIPVGAHVVTSPSPGIFWCAPEPGAPPFTDVGLRVDASSTIGIVEIMKLMNHVKASVAGEVVAVFVANGVAVERDDPLVAVMPDPGGAGR